MSLDIGLDRSLTQDVSRNQGVTQTVTRIDPGIAALQQVTNAAVTQAYGHANADVAGARLEELGQFDRERAVETVRDNPGALGPVQDRAAAARLAKALPVVYASVDIARPPITAGTLEHDGVMYAVQGLNRVRDESGATQLAARSNERAVAYLDRERGFPYTFHIRAFHPDASFGGVPLLVPDFTGDDRGFSTSLRVSSRVQQTIVLDTSDDTLTTEDGSSPSHHPWRESREADPTSSIDRRRVTVVDSEREGHVFDTQVQGSNPLVPGSPNIDVDGHFNVYEDLANGRLTIESRFTGDNFPNTEAFVTDNRGTSVFLSVAKYEGSPLSLMGENHNRLIMQSNIQISLSQNGAFTGITSNGRTYTPSQWNNFVRQNPQ